MAYNSASYSTNVTTGAAPSLLLSGDAMRDVGRTVEKMQNDDACLFVLFIGCFILYHFGFEAKRFTWVLHILCLGLDISLFLRILGSD